jgi:hypothetical protein
VSLRLSRLVLRDEGEVSADAEALVKGRVD